MGITFTFTATIRDWQALQALHHVTLVALARASGAGHYRVYRNRHDASQVLVVAVLPDEDALHAWWSAWHAPLDGLLQGRPGLSQTWEPTGWEELG